MRVFSAPALLVCLAGLCRAGDWEAAIGKGTDAFHRAAWDEALTTFQAAWPLAKAPAEQAITANDIGATLHALTRDKEALPWFDRAVNLWRGVPGRAEELAETALGLMDIYRGFGDFTSAEQSLRELLRGEIAAEQRAALLNTLGDMLREQSRRQEARENFESALALQGISDKRRIECYLGLADLDRGTGQFAASIEKWNRVLELARASGSKSSEALGLRGLGLTWIDTREYAKAERVLRRSLAIFRQEPAPAARQLAAAYTCLGRLFSQQGKFSLAEEAYLQAYELEQRVSGERHPQTAVIMESLAGVYAFEKRFDEAELLAKKALEIMTASFGAQSIPAAGALASLALVKQQNKRMDAAAADYSAALKTMRANGVPSDQNMLDVMDRYARVLTALRRPDEAKELRNQIKPFRSR